MATIADKLLVDYDVAPNKSALAAALIKDKIITEAQLTRAQRIQALLEEPVNLLQVLLELGEITENDLSEAVTRHGRSMHIGELLLEQGHISAGALRTALERQSAEGGRLGAILIGMGEINERIMLRMVARQRGIPFMEPAFAMVDTDLMRVASPEFLQRHCFVPFSSDEAGRVMVVVNDVANEEVLGAIRDLYQDRVQLALGPADAIIDTIEDYRRYREEGHGPGAGHAAGEDSLIEQVNHIIHRAIQERASDVHLEPMADRVRLRFRIDGVLVHQTDLPKELLTRLVSRIKIMAEIDIADHHHHQGGRILFPYKGIDYDLRVSIYITVHGENVVVRILNKELALVSLQELGMSPELQRRFKREVLDVPSGVVLITAPTGEGKTTTLYSCLDYSNEESVKIITAEDPVEYMLGGVVQCAIQEKVGRSFESTLREIVRQDPDIVVLGEIRDRPTARFAIEAALTGHKVYCTFHTEDSVAALLRLIEMEVEPFLIASTVRSVLAQRLLRRVCAECAVADTPTVEVLDALGIDPLDARRYEFKRGRGCANCHFTGYRGRVAVFECLILNEGLRTAVYHREPADVLHELAFHTAGTVALREDAVVKATRGITTLSEVKRKTPIPYIMRSIEEIIHETG